METTEKKKRGRKPQDKQARGYTLDRQIAEFMDSLPESERSIVVNNAIAALDQFQRSPQFEQWQQSPAYVRWLKGNKK